MIFSTFELLINWSTLSVFMFTVLILLVMPGPDSLFMISTGITQGKKVAFFGAVGIVLSMYVHTLLAALGFSAIIATSPIAFETLRYAGVGYLIWIAYHSFSAPALFIQLQPSQRTYLQNLLKGFLTNLLNPKAILFCSVFLMQFTQPKAGHIFEQVLFLGFIMNTMTLIYHSSLGYFSSYMGQFFTKNQRFQKIFSRFIGVTFLGLAARLLLITR